MAVVGKVLVGSGGRAFSGAYGTPDAPTSADVAALAGLGWTDLGIVGDDGVSFQDEKTIVKIMGWKERRPVRKIATDRSTTVSFGMRQWNTENLVLALGGGDFDVNGTYTPSDGVVIPETALAIAWVDGDDEFLLYFPKGQAGSSVTFNLKKDANILLPVEFEVTADDDDVESPFYLFTDSQSFGSES